MDLRLSPVQIRNRLILAARRIVAEHTPDAEGICPVCGVLHCEAFTVARGYLAGVEGPAAPPFVGSGSRSDTGRDPGAAAPGGGAPDG